MMNSLSAKAERVPALVAGGSKLQFSRAYHRHGLLSKRMQEVERLGFEENAALLDEIAASQNVLLQSDQPVSREQIMRLVVDLFGGYPAERQAGMEAMKETLITYLAAREDLTIGALHAAIEKVHLECKFVPSIAEFFEKLSEAQGGLKSRITLYGQWICRCEEVLTK